MPSDAIEERCSQRSRGISPGAPNGQPASGICHDSGGMVGKTARPQPSTSASRVNHAGPLKASGLSRLRIWIAERCRNDAGLSWSGNQRD